MILVDTSVWIEYFSGNNSKADIVSEFIDNNTICINEAILGELVPVIKHKNENKLANLLSSIRCYPLVVNWELIIQFQIQNLKNGINAVGLIDLMIVQNIIENDLILFSFDKHFRLMSEKFKFKII